MVEELRDFYEALEQADRVNESLLDIFIEKGYMLEDTELQGPYEDWIEATRIMLQKTKAIAKTNMMDESVDSIQNELDNLS